MISWGRYNCHEHRNSISLQNAHLVPRTHGLPAIKILSNLKQHKKQDTSILIQFCKHNVHRMVYGQSDCTRHDSNHPELRVICRIAGQWWKPTGRSRDRMICRHQSRKVEIANIETITCLNNTPLTQTLKLGCLTIFHQLRAFCMRNR